MTAAEARRRALAMRESWSAYQISQYLTRNGYPVSLSTVKRWTNPEWAAQERERNRKRSRERARRKRATLTRVRVLDEHALMYRLRALRDAGVTYACAARVVQLDHGVSLTEDEVRYALKFGRAPRKVRAATERQGVTA